MIIFNADFIVSFITVWGLYFSVCVGFNAGVVSHIIVTFVRSEVLVATVLHIPAHQHYHFPSDYKNRCSDKEQILSHLCHLTELSEIVLDKINQYQMSTVNNILRFDPEQGGPGHSTHWRTLIIFLKEPDSTCSVFIHLHVFSRW